MLVKCNECRKKFKVGVNDFKRKSVTKDIDEVYLECQNCGAEFHSYYVNDKVGKLLKENRNLRSIDLGLEYAEEIKKNMLLIDKEQEKIKRKLGEREVDK